MPQSFVIQELLSQNLYPALLTLNFVPEPVIVIVSDFEDTNREYETD